MSFPASEVQAMQGKGHPKGLEILNPPLERRGFLCCTEAVGTVLLLTQTARYGVAKPGESGQPLETLNP